MSDSPLNTREYPSRVARVSSVSRKELLVLHALTVARLSRGDVDAIGGQENGPDLIRRLRKRGFSIPIQRRRTVTVGPGLTAMKGNNFYELTSDDRQAALGLLTEHLEHELYHAETLVERFQRKTREALAVAHAIRGAPPP